MYRDTISKVTKRRSLNEGSCKDIYTTYVGVEVHTVLTMKVSSVWNVTPCGLVEVYRHFEENASFVFGVKQLVKQLASRKQADHSASCLLLTGHLFGLLLGSKGGGGTTPKRR
jgi:hypothetical protein